LSLDLEVPDTLASVGTSTGLQRPREELPLGRPHTNDLPRLHRPLLLLIDFQRLFTDPTSPAYVDGVEASFPAARSLVEAFDRRGFPVLRTRHVHPPDDDGGVNAMFWSRLQRAEDPLSAPSPEIEAFAGTAPLLDKARSSALSNARVREAVAAADAVVIAGVQTQICVLATALDVARQDVRPIVVGDASGARSAALHDATLEILGCGHAHVVAAEDVIAALGADVPNVSNLPTKIRGRA
jgi:maleamate amidohydrolase